MANERLYQFPAKTSPVPADIVYVGDSANSDNEVYCTIAQIIAAYPNLSGIAGLTLGANTFPYSNGSSAITAGSISSLAVSLLADTTTGTMQSTLGLVIGTNVEAHSAALDSIAGLTTSANEMLYLTGSNTYAVITSVNNGVLITGSSGLPSLLANSVTPGYVLTANSGAPPSWQSASASGSITTIDGDSGSIIPSSGVVTISGGSTGLTTSGSGATLDLTGTLNLGSGGTNHALTASAGGIVWSDSTKLDILAGTATAGLALLSGNAATPTWSATAPLLTGGGTMSGNIAMSTNSITGMADPVNLQDAATKNYVDNIATGGAAPCVAASTAALTVTYSNGVSGVGATLTNAGAQATFSLDGQSPTIGQRVLIKNQASTFQNGIYTVTNVGSGSTNWILTRATDYDTVSDINDTGVVPVTAGTANTNTGWVNTTTMVMVGTTAITFVQFGASYPISLTNGGTNASLTASNGGIVWSNASQLQILAGTSTAGLLLQSGATATPSWLATADNAVLSTNGSGVPSWSTTLPSGLTIPGYTASTNPLAFNGRLTLTSGLPVTTADVTAATTIYYTPYKGNQISIYNGTNWTTLTFAETSLIVPASASQMYDIFAQNNSGTLKLIAVAWTNDTTRATGLSLQNGIYCETGTLTNLYLGSFRTTTVSGQTQDAKAGRYVWNYFNRVARLMLRQETTATWTYSTATYRQANGAAANQLDYVMGISEDLVTAQVSSMVVNSTSTNRAVFAGIGVNSTTVNSATLFQQGAANSQWNQWLAPSYSALSAIGRNTLVWLEQGNGTDTQTWYGTNTGVMESGISGTIFG